MTRRLRLMPMTNAVMVESGETPTASGGWMSHLIELRRRLMTVTIVVIVIFAVLAFFSDQLYSLLAAPMLAVLPPGSQLVAIDPLTPFSTPLRLALYLAIIAAAPVLLYQAWAFIAPGLYQREKRVAAPLLVSAMLLFYAFEDESLWLVLGFAISCALLAVYGFMKGDWSIAAVGGIWVLIALKRWQKRRLAGKPAA